MARFGGLFHLRQRIPNPFEKKRRFDNALHDFRRSSPSVGKNSTAQNWHKAAQNFRRGIGFVRLKTLSFWTRRLL
jgi:hypothetical protein